MARPAVFLNPDLNTPEDIARAQALLGAIAPNYGKAANVGEGIAQLMIGVGTGIKNRKLAKAETAGRTQGNSAFEKIMGAMSGANTQFPAAPSMGGTPQEAATSSAPAPNAAGASAFKAFNGDPTSVVSYANDGAIRNQPVTSNLQSNLADAITAVYGPGYKASVYSGGQTGKRRTGSVRHDNGRAADVYVIGPDGRKVQGDVLAPLGQYWAARKYGGVGMEMHGGGIHLDEWSTPPRGGGMAWNYAKQGGQYTPAMQQAIALGLKGQMPSQLATRQNAPVQPQQVASLDPSAGMASMAPIPAPKPGIQAIAAAMGNPAPNGMAAPQQAPQQMAQAAPSDIPPMPQNEASSLDRIIGMNTPLGAPQPQGLDVGMLMQAAQNPWLTDTQKTMVNTLLQQEMQKQDPAYQMQQQAAQVGLQRDQLQLEQMRDPSKVPMSPMEQLQMQKSQLELQQLQNPAPKWDIVTGKDGSVFRIDPQTGKHETIYGPQAEPVKPTADIQEYEYAKGQGFQGTFQDFQLAVKKAGASQVNIDQKAEGAFDKKLAEQQATTFDTMATEGMNAKSELAVIGELNGLLKGQGGTLTGLSGALAKYGIGGDGIGDLQAADALINKLIPSQRQPGSGSMSDRDVEMFKASLPSLWKTPGGNQIILQTMEGLAQYKQAQGDIAQRVMTGEIGRQEAVKMLRELPNPLAGVGKTDAPEGVDPSAWEYMTPEERALWK